MDEKHTSIIIIININVIFPTRIRSLFLQIPSSHHNISKLVLHSLPILSSVALSSLIPCPTHSILTTSFLKIVLYLLLVME